jgi:hypothetical protein
VEHGEIAAEEFVAEAQGPDGNGTLVAGRCGLFVLETGAELLPRFRLLAKSM